MMHSVQRVMLSVLARFVCGWCVIVAMSEQTTGADPTPSTRINFERDVRPLLMGRCVKCHGGESSEAGLRLDQVDSAKQVLKSGVIALVPGVPERSGIIQRVTSQDPDTRMPPQGAPLTAAEVDVLKRWIAAGAAWPSHWAYEPLQNVIAHPSDLSGDHASRSAANPIDVLIDNERRAVGLKGTQRADRQTLARRLYLDLWGLAPTPDEVAELVEDDRPDAVERLTDRLLASPHYGERWARHWMDIVHFAETHGHDQDRPRDHAWPYRDYLIRAFNEDRPFSQFIHEQLAADVLPTTEPADLAATGMLSAGSWDESSLRDIRDDTLDREIARYLDRDDILTTVMQTFLSTTVHCARCHDHKFDPVSQRDYYALQAVFAGTDKGNRKYDPDPQLGRRRRELSQSKARTQEWLAQKSPELLKPDLQAEVAAWEQAVARGASSWQAIAPTDVRSSGGATLTRLPDSSVLSEGTRPEKDVVTFTLETSLPQVSGLRIEVLTDDRLPHRGPGRQDNGNLHLSEIVVSLVPQDGSAARRLELVNPQADFNQTGWSIDKAIDGNPATAWGIYPEVGKPHQAVIGFKSPVSSPNGLRLTVELHQIHGGGHLIGRTRLSVSESTVSLTSEVLPDDLIAILKTPTSQRSDDQRRALAAHYVQRRDERLLAALPPQPMVYCGGSQFEVDGSFRPAPAPRVVKLLHRGEITQPRNVVEPAALGLMKGVRATLSFESSEREGERRLALARWLSQSSNSLVWRSIANRLWQQHFGRGLVDTPNDFGGMGSAPTHPQLLDWLAGRLLAHGGSMKALHREIVTSDTYLQSSQHDEAASQMDGDNRLLWRMSRRRLDAESIRDSLLRLSNSLDPRMGGPSDRHFVLTPGVHVTPNVDYVGFDVNHVSNHRRSVYRFLFRTLPDPFMETLDCPDGSQLMPQRGESMTALQALATLNDKTLVRLCERLAADIQQQHAPSATSREHITALFRLLFLRAPTTDELAITISYADRFGLANTCRWLVNSNEFMFVE